MNTRNRISDTVLIVDDALDSIRMLNDVLENAGMTVLVALEGAQALNISRNITPDIVLLDALMPNMDGFETCRQLKRNPALADVPIIFMTGLSDTEHVVMGLNAGGVDYVTKPINPDELIARMQVHLANARIAQSARQALDQTGQYLFAIDHAGQLLWATPQVHQRLHQAGYGQAEDLAVLGDELSTWLSHQPQPGHHLAPQRAGADGPSIEFLARVSAQENLLRLIDNPRSNDASARLRDALGLTGREADVMLWIANGKTNREIGQILDMSPRTVNKHLEQVFRKLGVENRTAAAAAAIRCLARF
ncbi:response regulator transcription factor [Halopseudomonas bauzanensis]|uniref:Response regulator transcription factor n=1 Tax=Halopseudomonas bauzanensis TaxID=653930 RepID=A0A4U0YT71_9GAMM|nr:response regulator transcription factor [Halopseudomonas bauzanensis]TKA93094.1 response regulator transcription factor [Halopseudomonas bauzanensis]